MDKVRLHLRKHWKINETNYLYLIVALVAGIAAGAFVVGCLDAALKEEIAVILENYRGALKSGERGAVSNVVRDSILPVLRQFAALAICGMTPLALAAGVAVLAAKGFAVGFFAAAATCCLAPAGGTAILLLLSAPYQLLSSAALLFASGVSTAHCKLREKNYIYALQMVLPFTVNLLAIFADVMIKGI